MLGQQPVVTDGHIGWSRFLTVDPEIDITVQPYEYASDDPVSLNDPTGLNDCGIFSAVCDVGHVATGAARATGSYVAHNYGSIAGVVAGGACIVVTAGTCAVGIVAATGFEVAEQYTNGTLTESTAAETILLGAAGVGTAGIGKIIETIGEGAGEANLFNPALSDQGTDFTDTPPYRYITRSVNGLAAIPFAISDLTNLLSECS